MEFFAGKANLSKCMKASGYRTASFDILYQEGHSEAHNSDFMDINSTSGFAQFDSNQKVLVDFKVIFFGVNLTMHTILQSYTVIGGSI